MKTVLVTVIICCLNVLTTFAQQPIPIWGQKNDRLYLNPAYAGVNPSVNLFTQQQWINVSGYTNTYFLTVDRQFGKSLHSAGLQLIYDRIGPFRDFTVKIPYSFRIPFADDTSCLRIGFAPVFTHGVLDLSGFRAPDISDPGLPTGNIYRNSLLIEAGVWLKIHKFYFGIAAQTQNIWDHYSENNFISNSHTYPFINIINFHAGYKFRFGRYLSVEPIIRGIHTHTRNSRNSDFLSLLWMDPGALLYTFNERLYLGGTVSVKSGQVGSTSENSYGGTLIVGGEPLPKIRTLV